ncbi:hypothetical protein WMY93_010199 [Mugilogobius chulae]|uniref:Uncharacterized protein n=1 Tax=Mugilogobius chulae TaxID=88201 RepID=A0AAW0P6T6_9GOBI
MANSKYWQKKIDVNYKNQIQEAFELAAKHHLKASWEKMSEDGPIDHCTFTYRLTVSEPLPKSKVSQPTEETQKEEEVAQELSKQPEKELPAKNTEPVEVTYSEESPTGLTEENPTTPAQDVPSEVDLLGLLPADVLPMLAAMGVIKETNGGVEWCEPTHKTTSNVVVESENLAEIIDSVIADVTHEDSLVSLEIQSEPAVSLVQSSTEQVAVVDTQQQVSTDETTDVSCLNSIEDQRCKPPGIVEKTDSDVTQKADGTPREQICIVPQENSNLPEEETTIEDEVITNIEEDKDLPDIEELDLTNMEDEDELEDVSRRT